MRWQIGKEPEGRYTSSVFLQLPPPSEDGPLPELPEPIHMKILPAGLAPGSRPSEYHAQWEVLGPVPAMIELRCGKDHLQLDTTQLVKGPADPARAAINASIDAFINTAYTGQPDDKEMVVHTFTGLDWLPTTVLLQRLQAMMPERTWTLAPARIGGYRKWEKGYELFEILHLEYFVHDTVCSDGNLSGSLEHFWIAVVGLLTQRLDQGTIEDERPSRDDRGDDAANDVALAELIGNRGDDQHGGEGDEQTAMNPPGPAGPGHGLGHFGDVLQGHADPEQHQGRHPLDPGNQTQPKGHEQLLRAGL